MDLSYGPEYEELRSQVRKFLADHKEGAPRALAGLGARPDEAAREWQRLLIDHGYAARTVPTEYGGYGADPDLMARIVIDEEFAAVGISRGIGGQGPDMLVPTLLEYGTEEQKRRWIRKTLLGEIIWCQGYSEPEAGSDLASLQTLAVLDGDHWVVNGQKVWTSSAHYADMMFCLVRTEPDVERHAGISYLLISMDTPGITVTPLRTMTGGSGFSQVFFTDVRVPRENLVGARGEGWKIANATLHHERNMLSSSGQMESVFQSLIRLMEEEQTGGARALDSPILRDRLLRLQGRLLATKANAMRLFTLRQKGERGGIAQLIGKLVGCELSHDMYALAIDVMAERGALYHRSKYERDGGRWQLQYMFSLGLIIGGGTAQIQKNIIAERGLGLPREPSG